jgi:DNA-binding transcriptional LysR family regulator
VGFASATFFQPLVPAIIRAYRERYPGVLLSPQQSNSALLIAGLRSHAIDVAFIRPPIIDAEGLTVLPLIEEPMLIVLPAAHLLASRAAIPLAALAPEKWILLPRAMSPGPYDQIIASCQRAGFSPNVQQEAPEITSIVYLVAAGFGVSIVPQSTNQIRAEGVRYLPIEGEGPRAPISLAYRRNDHSPPVRNFVELARRTERAAHRERATG